MPNLSRNWWRNYHGNITGPLQSSTTYLRDPGASSMTTRIDALRESAEILKSFIDDLIRSGSPVCVVGSGWTLSDLLSADTDHLQTEQLDYIVPLARDDLHKPSPFKASECVLVGGGAKTYQLVDHAEQRGLSISTCGSYLGPSVAGALATSVNGSTLGFGGFQNQVIGLHLVVSGERSVWLERASQPLLANGLALRFADSIVRSDEIFDGALVHLGGMGVVNAVAFQLTEKRVFSTMRSRARVNEDWLLHLSRGEYRDIARFLGHDQAPDYYEVQIDPFAPFDSPALHTLFFQRQDRVPDVSAPARVAVSDALAHAGRRRANPPAHAAPPSIGGLPSDVFAYYSENFFEETPGGLPTGAYSFGQLHEEPPRQELQGQIYTAAFSIDRNSVADVIPLLKRKLFERLKTLPSPQNECRHILYTLRFVSHAAGALTFTPFPDSIVFDIEGLMPSPVSDQLGRATYAALNRAKVPYARHWAKLLPSSAAQVERGFGPSTQADSRIARWRRARNELVPPVAQRVFQSKALRDWGLV